MEGRVAFNKKTLLAPTLVCPFYVYHYCLWLSVSLRGRPKALDHWWCVWWWNCGG